MNYKKIWLYQNTCPSKSSRTCFQTFVLHYCALLCFTKHCSSLHYFASIASLCLYTAETTSEHVKGWSALPYLHAQSRFLCMFLSTLCQLGLPHIWNVELYTSRIHTLKDSASRWYLQKAIPQSVLLIQKNCASISLITIFHGYFMLAPCPSNLHLNLQPIHPTQNDFICLILFASVW